MLPSYFKRKTTLTAYYNSPAGTYLNEFTDWLSERGFLHETIRKRIHGAVAFSHWAYGTNTRLEDLTPDSLTK
jgi:hypothetical protein